MTKLSSLTVIGALLLTGCSRSTPSHASAPARDAATRTVVLKVEGMV